MLPVSGACQMLTESIQPGPNARLYMQPNPPRSHLDVSSPSTNAFSVPKNPANAMPNDPTKAANKKPRAKRKKKSDEHQPSTNISSPVRRKGKRQVVQQEESDEDDAFEPGTVNGYEKDDFVVDDDEVEYEYDDDTLQPTTPHRRKSNRQELSMATLSPERHQFVEAIKIESKRQCRSIMMTESLRIQPFSDTIIEEIALRIPKTKDDLLRISGIDPEMVRLYGQLFLKIVANSMNIYNQVKGIAATDQASPIQSGKARSQGISTFKPYDPNHQEVITIEDDDDDDFDVSDADGSMEKSSYFTPKQNADVAAFNAHWGVKRNKTPGSATANRSEPGRKPAPQKRKDSSKKVDFSAFASNSNKKRGGNSGSASRGIGMMPI